MDQLLVNQGLISDPLSLVLEDIGEMLNDYAFIANGHVLSLLFEEVISMASQT